MRERVHSGMARVRADLAELVAIRPEDSGRVAEWVVAALSEVGLKDIQLVSTPDGQTVVHGERPGPPDAPTVLLYARTEEGPGEAGWRTPPFELTERDGRWYGRGAAGGKGNLLMHLAALRALAGDVPVPVKVVVDGGGLAGALPSLADRLRADAILFAATGNAAAGVPAVTTALRGLAEVEVSVATLERPADAGRFAGAAPDALAALIHMLATLRDAKGNTTVAGLPATGRWDGMAYAVAQFRRDATVLDRVDLLGGTMNGNVGRTISGTVADMVWARPAVTVVGIDCPPVSDAEPTIQPTARARLHLRVPPGTDPAAAAQALVTQLESEAPWGVRVSTKQGAVSAPFRAATTGPAYAALGEAMHLAYGKQLSLAGHGGSIELCRTLADTYPHAEIILLGVAEPRARAGESNESVDPAEIELLALAEALFLGRYAMVAV